MQIFFEHYFVPSFHFASQAVLNLYASGRTTGLVVGCGEGISYSVPVYEGVLKYRLPYGISNLC
jgi:actin-related protein